MGISIDDLSPAAQRKVIRKLLGQQKNKNVPEKDGVTLTRAIKYVIEGDAVSKKNSMQIFVNKTTGKPFISPSKAYKEYEYAASAYLVPRPCKPIINAVRVKAVYYRKTHRRVDLANLLNATCDILVRYQIIADDCADIVKDHDGSRVYYDKDNPRAEIEIIPIGGD